MNYFNYFTEIEEHFQRKRGAQVWLSPLDWALIASWRDAGIPLAAALAGIDQAFEKFESGRRRDAQRPRALVYCAAAVAAAAETMQAAAVGAPAEAASPAPEDDAFSRERITDYLTRAREAVAAHGCARGDILESLDGLLAGLRSAATPMPALPEIDRLLTVLDDKLFLELQRAVAVEEMVAIRAELERELAPYRRKLRPEQLAMIEHQFLQRRLLERARLPRLSLFYMP